MVLVALLWAAPAGATTGLAGEWRFDEGSGRVARDTSGSGLDGQLGASAGGWAVPAWVPGVAGSALHFDGDDYVRLPDARALEPQLLTVEAWVRRAGTPGMWRYVISKGAAACDHSSYGLYTGESTGMAFYVSGPEGYVISPQASPAAVWDGRWHQVAGVYDGGSVRLYLDGAEVGHGRQAPTAISYGLSSQSAYLGTYRGDCELPFAGDIDNVRLWSIALSPVEIAKGAVRPAGRPPIAVAPGPVGGPSQQSHPLCLTVRPNHTRLRVGRRVTLKAVVRHRGTPVARVKVRLKGRGLRSVTRRSDSRGRVSFRVRPRKTARLRLVALGQRSSCPAPIVRVRAR